MIIYNHTYVPILMTHGSKSWVETQKEVSMHPKNCTNPPNPINPI